jgi:phage terminase large subunit-like protein
LICKHLTLVIFLMIGAVMVEAEKGFEHSFTANQYISDVIKEKIVTCKWVKLAVRRHIKDLKRANKDDSFPYYFDEEAAQKVIRFKQNLKHTKGEWADPARKDRNFFKLEPWQQFIDYVIFGWRKKDSGYRRFTRAYISVARKNGKTTNAAATGNYCAWADYPKEIGAECYCVATKRDQAKISWNDACRQVSANSVLAGKIRIHTNSMFIPGTASKFMPLGRDSKTEDGLNPHFALIDEYHAHLTDELLEIIATGMGARRQPLIYIITTAGFDINSPCRLEEEKAQKVLEGSIVDESYFAIIYTLDEGDDWIDRNVWIKSNPNLGVSVYENYLEDAIKKALDMPSKMNQVKTKNLNIWTQARTQWIVNEKWLRCCGTFDIDNLVGRACYSGLDLSSSLALTALVHCFPPQMSGEPYKLICRFFLPENDIIERSQKDRIDYKKWADNGLLILTPGDVIDYDIIEQVIQEDHELYSIKEIAYDPWKAQEIINHVSEFGIEMVPIFQRYSGMAVPTHEFEKAVMSATLATNNNPILTWMMACTEVKSDRQGNIMPMKPERDSTGKWIDGIVASIMAYYRASIAEASVYETQGVFAV